MRRRDFLKSAGLFGTASLLDPEGQALAFWTEGFQQTRKMLLVR